MIPLVNAKLRKVDLDSFLQLYSHNKPNFKLTSQLKSLLNYCIEVQTETKKFLIASKSSYDYTEWVEAI